MGDTQSAQQEARDHAAPAAAPAAEEEEEQDEEGRKVKDAEIGPHIDDEVSADFYLG